MCLIFLLPAWLDTDLGGGSKPEARDETALKESSILRGEGEEDPVIGSPTS